MPNRRSPLAYLHSQFISAEQAQLPVWDRGVVQAATVTEMIRTFARRPFRVAEHLARLRSSLAYLQVTIPESDADLAQIIEHLIAHNGGELPARAELGVVILVTAGALPMYAGELPHALEPTVCVHTFPLPFRQWAHKYTHGQPLVVPSIRQVPFEIISPTIKHRSRLHWYLADREAATTDPGAVALLATQAGHLTETNSGNFFIVRNGGIVTPPPDETLPGISQSFVRELATELSIPYEERSLTIDAVHRADEAFVSSTTYCILPVDRINRQRIGAGPVGPVTRRLLAAWSDRIGYDIVAQATEEIAPL